MREPLKLVQLVKDYVKVIIFEIFPNMYFQVPQIIFIFFSILGSNINQSLMTLGTVIRKLSDGASTAHIPFRDSKLTRILQNSLGGNTKTAIVCTVTPVEKAQTKSTLEFATRSKNIVQHAHVNEVLDERALMNRLETFTTDSSKDVQFTKYDLLISG